jgi:polysaccharide chain length determinant protein (PEP-CTERM system associated)
MAVAFDKTILLEIGDRILRSWWTIVAGLCLGATCAVAAMHYLPKVYEATTKIFVAPQRIPQDFVRTTVVDDISLRMASLEQAVLSRPYLSKLIEAEFQPVPDSEEGMERLVQTIRARVEVLVSSGVFEIAYRDVDPARAARVANTLAGLYIQENSRYRTKRAEEATSTVQDFATRVRKELDAQEKKIAQFKQDHLYETKDRQDANLQMLNSRQKELESKEIQLANAREGLRAIAELEALPDTTSSTSAPTVSILPGENRVSALERELKVLQLRYSDEHPQVRAKRRELEEARAAAIPGEARAGSSGSVATAPGPSETARGQRAALAAQVRDLEADVKSLRAEIAVYENRIERTPQVELALSELSKGYDVLQEQYHSYQTKVEAAKSAQEMEETRKGEQFEVIERALPPALPVQPAPMQVFGLALVSGLLAFVGPIVLTALLKPAINSEQGLRAIAPEIPVLVAIPRLRVPDTLRRDSRRRLKNFGLSIASAAVLAVAVLIW